MTCISVRWRDREVVAIPLVLVIIAVVIAIAVVLWGVMPPSLWGVA